ncbi:MAG: dihydrolipoyl dehydrogenase [Desulfuromonas sp.]|nr:MAG: dihydrolipoyl dehydrogenase [Desulfuromonas sp.]
MSDTTFDLIVIGGGPGGYVAAIRAAQLGQSVAVVEQRASLGGVCLNEGCIPSKALLDSSELFARARDEFDKHGILIEPPRLDLAKLLKRKQDVVTRLTRGIASLFKKNGITHLTGSGRLVAGPEGEIPSVAVKTDNGETTYQASRVLLATGSRAIEIPPLPFEPPYVVDAAGALSFETVPEHLVVIGGGYIGLELGTVWARLGSKVTVVEMLPEILPPTDRDAAKSLQKLLEKQGLTFRLGTKLTGAARDGEQITLSLEIAKGNEELTCDRVLVSAGRRPNTEQIGLQECGVELDQGRIKVDDDYQTSCKGVYAIGDLVPGPMLAHKASEEGVVFAERLDGQSSRVDYDLIPGIIYTHPEIAAIGKTEQQLKEESREYTVGKFPFMASGRAKAMNATDGFVKVLAAPQSGRILGVTIMGPHASEMLGEALAVMAFAGSAKDVALMCHAHPTLSEAFKEACLAALGEAIHA